jgi:hypothetical protein
MQPILIENMANNNTNYKQNFIRNQATLYMRNGATKANALWLAGQDALESAYGAKVVGKNNYGNLTTRNAKESANAATTLEYDADGNPVGKKTMRYTNFNSNEEYIQAKLDRLKRLWKVDVAKDNPDMISSKLQDTRRKYATSPTYKDAMARMYNTANKMAGDMEAVEPWGPGNYRDYPNLNIANFRKLNNEQQQQNARRTTAQPDAIQPRRLDVIGVPELISMGNPLIAKQSGIKI